MLTVVRVAVAATATLAVCFSAKAAQPPTIVVQVVDYAHGSIGVLVDAQHHVAQVLGAVGIKAVWREVPKPEASSGPGHVTVLILSDSMTAAKTVKDRIAREVLGTAIPPPTRRAWIFLSRIEDMAAAQGRSAGHVLGHVIVHEIAHMVAHIGHSDVGVMASTVRGNGDVFQGFTAEQGRLLRAALQQKDQPVVLDARNRSRRFQ
jgi:hypothetical protein